MRTRHQHPLQLALLLAALPCTVAGCTHVGSAADQRDPSNGVPKQVTFDRVTARRRLAIFSSDITAGQMIPDRFSDYGEQKVPKIGWSDPPVDTRSIVVLVEDSDAPGEKPFVHWLVLNLPAATRFI